MRSLILTALIVTVSGAPSFATPPRPVTRAVSSCLVHPNGPLRVAYHPSQSALRCTRVLGTQTVEKSPPDLHT